MNQERGISHGSKLKQFIQRGPWWKPHQNRAADGKDQHHGHMVLWHWRRPGRCCRFARKKEKWPMGCSGPSGAIFIERRARKNGAQVHGQPDDYGRLEYWAQSTACGTEGNGWIMVGFIISEDSGFCWYMVRPFFNTRMHQHACLSSWPWRTREERTSYCQIEERSRAFMATMLCWADSSLHA